MLDSSAVRPTSSLLPQHYRHWASHQPQEISVSTDAAVNVPWVSRQQNCQRLDVLQAENLTVWELAQLIGHLSSSLWVVFPAPLYYHNLQQDKITALHYNKRFDSPVVLSPVSVYKLTSWIQHIRDWNSQSLLNQSPDCVIQTEAPQQGWGACMSKVCTGGSWSLSKQNLHINLQARVLSW